MLRSADREAARPDDGPSFADLAQQVLDDGKAYLGAEARLARLRGEAKARAYRPAVQLGIAAAVVATAGLVAFAVAIVIALASLIGPIGGGLVAVLLFVAVAGLLGLLAKRAWDKVDG